MVDGENTESKTINSASSPEQPATVRPTKKQRELLSFITEFIAAHGYSPSYREIMAGCNYTSVATVSLHVNNLIKRGHLVKRGHSARSLEVVGDIEPATHTVAVNRVNETEEKWLVLRVEQFFKIAESEPNISTEKIDELYVLVGALKIFGLEGASYSFIRRLNELKKRVESSETFSV